MVTINKMKRTTVFLSEAQVKGLEKAFEDSGINAAEAIRRALDEWLEERHQAQLLAKRDPVLRPWAREDRKKEPVTR
jgi:Arc/MetJ-type ribon-helix-helix transcriptional regulator